MASGKLGSANLSAETDTLLFTAAAGKITTANIRWANRNLSSVKIRLAIGSGASPATTDYLEYDLTLTGNGITEDTGLILSAGEKCWVRSDTANVSVRAHGLEQ